MSRNNDSTQYEKGSGVGGAILRYTPSKIVEPLLGLFALPFLTRSLGVEGYGVWSVVVLTASLMYSVGYNWNNNCALRFCKAMNNRRDEFFSNLVAGFLYAMIVLGALLVIGRGHLPESVRISVGAFLWWAFVDALFVAGANCGEMLFRARHKSLDFTLSRIFQGVARHVLGVGALILGDGNLQFYFMARIGGMALIGSWSWTRNDVWRHLRPRSLSWLVQKQFLLFGFPLSVVILATSLRILANRFVVLSLSGEEATGLFSVAVNIGGAPLLIFQQVVMLGLYPLAIDAWEKTGDITRIVFDGQRLFLFSSLPAMTGLALLSKPVLILFAGEEYAESWPVLALISSATLFYGLSQYYSLQLMVSKRTGLMALIGLAATIINIGLSLLMVPIFGYEAAALSTLIANGLLLLGMMIWSGISPRHSFPARDFGGAILAAALMAAAVVINEKYSGFALIPRFIVSICLGVLVYGFVLWRTGLIEREFSSLKDRFPWRW